MDGARSVSLPLAASSKGDRLDYLGPGRVSVPRALLAGGLFVALAAAAGATAAPTDVVCSDCHEEVVLAFAMGPHAGNDAEAQLAACSSCHGDSTAPLEDG